MSTILVVDDNESIRNVVATILSDRGYRVAQAENGHAALEVLGQMEERPCLILLDFMMPVMSGPEFLAVVRRGHRLAPLPIVVMSATADPADIEGPFKVLRKPATMQLLLHTVEEFCGKGTLASAAVSEHEPCPTD